MTETASGPPEIRLSELTKDFREVRAVDHVSLDIRSGEFLSLLGPSGCGKTTTLRMIGGFELPTAGRIELRGRDVTRDPPDKRPVNMVFQNIAWRLGSFRGEPRALLDEPEDSSAAMARA
jgi:ABC-type Fe3+/spermidine/putrescine transport system ATPase subunit